MDPLILAAWPCLRLEGKAPRQRLVIDVSVSPNAKRTEVVGWHDGALRLRLAAPPVDGAANDALQRWLASQLKLPQSRIELVRGATARRKQWALDTPLEHVCQWLETLTQSGQLAPWPL
ncbi:DUF167 domain-containing protein [Aquabacterium sp. CECT 9606]|uniref:DUF167 domain-containing protein n=1 Tax=Aquabacterium sp. CECT 9606 TaxID=2845822 RepID=UPI001E624800|nr:DUF167 domain-containing protein [Aquabacterium sp. CECT 9606]CAH0349482.1 hypothetical protein AQB9606_01094 [Aquabacterium sp. CECT 9606]